MTENREGGTVGVRQWTIDELVALVRGCQIVGRDREAQAVALPADLTMVAVPDARPWEHRVGRDHHSVFGSIVATWWTALETPGELHCVVVKRQFGGRWHDVEVTIVNLLDQPEYGFVLTSSRQLGRTDPPAEPGSSDAAAGAAPCFIQHLDEMATVTRTEGDVEAVFGRLPAELVGMRAGELIHPDDRDVAVATWLELVASPGASRTMRYRVARPDGSSRWIQAVLMNHFDSTGTILAVCHDITAQRDQEQALAESEQELRFLTEAVPVAVFRASGEGIISFGNTRWSTLFEDPSSLTDVYRHIHEDDRSLLVQACAEARTSRVRRTTRVRTAGATRYLEFRLQGVGGGPGIEDGTGVIGTVDDVTADMLRTFHLEATAERDALTGLANRLGLTRKLEEAVAEGDSALVLFGDLDGFKTVNDEWGHDVGDQVLVAVGALLREVVRPDDVVGRWGGDEFVIVCDRLRDGAEQDLISRLHAALSDGVVVDGTRHPVRMSLGAVRPSPGELGQDVLRRADAAMYDTKRSNTRC
jgi:diguanylate cyclase (GGDEF)-like protein/PAS domain S-box-containing protein